MITERNVANLLIAKSVNTTLTATQTITSSIISSMNTGETIVTSPGGVIVDAAGTLPKEFKIGVKNTDGKIQWSDLINAGSIKSIYTKKYSVATQQVDYIGYNGTSGSLDVINSNIYTIRLYLVPLDLAGFAQQRIKRGVYQSDSTATQTEIAAGLAQDLITNLSKEPETIKYGTNNIKIERVNAGSDTATSGGTISVTKGSKYVTILGTGADAGKYNADGATIVAGDVLRFGTTGTLTSPCYVVSSVVSGGGATTMVVLLDIPYQGTSDSAVAAASVCVVPAASIGNWGIKITGSSYKFDAPKFGYLLPRWKTTLQDCGVTTVTESATATEGTGTYEQVAYMEQQFQGNEGMWYRAQVPYPTYRTEAASGSTYAVIQISFEDKMGSTLGTVVNSYKQLYIACVKGAGTTYSNANTGLGTTLNAYLTAYTSIESNGVTIASEIAA